MQVIQSDNLTKVYSAKPRTVTAVDNLSLSVDHGQIFGLLGPNGAGKTTFIKILLGIVAPTSGSARVLGEDAGSLEAKERIGFLPENHKYPFYLSGEQVLRFFGRLSGLDDATLARRIDDVLRIVDMEQWRKVKVRKYSKGMLQRIGLAQALLNDPALLILDEPTDGVDPIGRKQIRDLLLSLRNAGKTIFLNSHLLSEVELICDRVAILNKGKLIRAGTVKELTESDHVYDIDVLSDIPEALRIDWEARRVRVQIEGRRLTFSAVDDSELNAILDALRAHGVLLAGVTPKRNTLEDLFIQVVSSEAP